MLTNVTEVTTQTLLNELAIRRPLGCRFVTMTCTDLGEAHDILYHFDKDYVLYNLRLKLPKGEALPSITGQYLAAFAIENEIKDMFGIPVQGMAIDYEGKFILSEGAPSSPQNKPVKEKPDPASAAPVTAAS